MPKEKQTDPARWRNKLDELDSLPGEAMPDKNAAWEKLSGRLYQKPSRNRAAWYWAAACSVAAVLVLWMASGEKNAVPGRALQSKQTKTAPVAPLPLSKEHIALPISKTGVEKKHPVKINLEKLNTAVVKSSHPIIPVSLVDIRSAMTETNTHNPTKNIIPVADTIAFATTVNRIKKKLRVVHINELDTPAPSEQMAFSGLSDGKKPSFRLGNRHSFTPPATAQEEYAGILKITLTN